MHDEKILNPILYRKTVARVRQNREQFAGPFQESKIERFSASPSASALGFRDAAVAPHSVSLLLRRAFSRQREDGQHPGRLSFLVRGIISGV